VYLERLEKIPIGGRDPKKFLSRTLESLGLSKVLERSLQYA
jgi:hypothetical protein